MQKEIEREGEHKVFVSVWVHRTEHWQSHAEIIYPYTGNVGSRFFICSHRSARGRLQYERETLCRSVGILIVCSGGTLVETTGNNGEWR